MLLMAEHIMAEPRSCKNLFPGPEGERGAFHCAGCLAREREGLRLSVGPLVKYLEGAIERCPIWKRSGGSFWER